MPNHWIKRDCGLRHHPRVLRHRLSIETLALAEELWCLARERQSDDVTDYWDADVLAGLHRWDHPEDIDRHLSALLASGLFSRICGRIVIHDWRQHCPDPTHADRQAAYRERRRVTKSDADRHVTERDVTQCNEVTRDGSDCHVTEVTPDQSRVEESRVEETIPPISPPTGDGVSQESQLSVVDPPARLTKTRTKRGPVRQTPTEREHRSVCLVYQHWRDQYHPKAPPDLDPASIDYRHCLARIRDGAAVLELCEAVDGAHRSPFHLGENDRGRRYLSLGLICRDAGHVAEFREILTQPEWLSQPASERQRREQRAIWEGEQALERERARQAGESGKMLAVVDRAGEISYARLVKRYD